MAISIGPLEIRVYGLLIMTGVLVGAFVASRIAPRHGLKPDWIWDMLPWVVLSGLIGARVWHVLFPPISMVEMGITTQYYLTHPLEAIAVWKGGLGMPGVILGGVAGLALYLYFKGMFSLLPRMLDVSAPALAIAQAIGRWGNYVNQELYGRPTNLPWAIYIAPENRIPGYEDVAYYHPLFLYESLLNLANFGLLLYIDRKYRDRLRDGDLFLIYLMVYGTIRFFLEFLRLDAAFVRTINVNQTLMAVVVLTSGLVLFLRHRRPGQAQAVAASGEAPRTARRHRKPKRRKRKR